MATFSLNNQKLTGSKYLRWILFLLLFTVAITPVFAIDNAPCNSGENCSENSKLTDYSSIRHANREKALVAISGYPQLVVWGANTMSFYNGTVNTLEQATVELNEKIIQEINNQLEVTKTPLVKGEFETSQAFELRQKEYEQQYETDVKARAVRLDQQRPAIYTRVFNDVLDTPVLREVIYDADHETFNLSISTKKVSNYVINAKIKVPLNKAKETKTKIESMIPWVVFQINGEKVIPKSIILQNEDGETSAIKRLDFIEPQDNQGFSIGKNTYNAMMTAKNQAKKAEHAAAVLSSKKPTENQAVQEKQKEEARGDVTWEIVGGKFNDGGTIIGWITTNKETGKITGFEIITYPTQDYIHYDIFNTHKYTEDRCEKFLELGKASIEGAIRVDFYIAYQDLSISALMIMFEHPFTMLTPNSLFSNNPHMPTSDEVERDCDGIYDKINTSADCPRHSRKIIAGVLIPKLKP